MEEGVWVERKQLVKPELLQGRHWGGGRDTEGKPLKTPILFRCNAPKRGRTIVCMIWFPIILHESRSHAQINSSVHKINTILGGT